MSEQSDSLDGQRPISWMADDQAMPRDTSLGWTPRFRKCMPRALMQTLRSSEWRQTLRVFRVPEARREP
jgi:hypothetical protein